MAEADSVEVADGDGGPSPPAVDPAAAATSLAANMAKFDPHLAGKAGAYFDKQSHLVDIQTEHLHEQRAIQLSHMRLSRLNEGFKVGLQSFLALAAAALGLIAFTMVWSAAHSHAVVVDAFDAPAALAARGLTGKVVAGDVLDTFQDLQNKTRTDYAKRLVAGGWSGDIKVVVPQTGISLGDIYRLLLDRLGHDTHIGGDLVQGPDGALTLTIRGDGVAAKSFTGGPTDLPALVRSAAEYAFGQAEPVLFGRYLFVANRPQEAIAFYVSAWPRARLGDRAELLNGWGEALQALGRGAEADERFQAAIALKPDLWIAWDNHMDERTALGGEEAGFRTGLVMERLWLSSHKAGDPRPPAFLDLAALREDWAAVLLGTRRDAALNNGEGTGGSASGPLLALAAMELHDWAGATGYMLGANPSDHATLMARHFVEGRRALEAGDLALATTAMEAFNTAYAVGDASLYLDARCYLGLVYALTGRTADAQGVFAKAARSVRCASFQADGLEHAGDRAGADRAYAGAVALAPSLPFAYQRWGLALLARGDLAGAEREFAAASARGAHWADPLKGQGDVLARQGRWKAARARYAEALAYAPAWAALR